MSKKKQKILILPDGTKEPVLKEVGKYYLCQGRQFRKGNHSVRVVYQEAPNKETRGEGDEE